MLRQVQQQQQHLTRVIGVAKPVQNTISCAPNSPLANRCLSHVRHHRYTAGSLARQSYLPFKVNATGVMPLIFASSLLSLPTALARFTDSAAIGQVAVQLGPGGLLYLPFNVALIVFFNYYYTFLQVRTGCFSFSGTQLRHVRNVERVLLNRTGW